MSKFWFLFLVSFSLAFTNRVQAENIEVLGFKARGKLCRGENAFFIQSGDTFAILFSQFGIELNAGNRAGGHVEVETCHVTMDLRLPEGHCLNGTEQLVRGGLIKSANTYGWVYAAYSLPGMADAETLRFRLGTEIRPEDAESLFELNLRDSGPRRCVKGKVRYQLLLQQGAWRKSLRDDFYNSNFDSVDGEVLLHLKTRR